MREGVRLLAPNPRLVAAEKPLAEQYPREERRWAVLLGLPMLGAAACIAVAIGTSHAWALGGAVLLGPGGVLAAIVYLALSTDTSLG
jgi:hypothetical protein